MAQKEINKKTVVLGAGPAGLNVGRGMLPCSVSVDILERESYAGGLCRTFEDNGYFFDLGPHNIHTNKENIYLFLKSILGDQLIQNSPKINIFFNGRFVPYPLKGIWVFKVLGNPWRVFCAFADFLFARILMFVRKPKKEKSFRDWITNRFGRTLYSIYFEPYAQKAWKISSDEISTYVAEKRVPLLSIRDHIRMALKLSPKTFHSEDWAKIKSYYPHFGVGQITGFLAGSFLETGGKIHLGINILEVKRDGSRIEYVRYMENREEKTLPVDFLFSTIPINDFIKLIRPYPPEDVLQAAAGLDFCSERLLYIKVNKETVFDSMLVYFQSPEIKFNRVYDLRRFSPYCVPLSKDAICIEFTCSYGDNIWNASDKELFEEAMLVFEKNKMLSRSSIEGFLTKEVVHAYPRFRIGFQNRLDTIFNYLKDIENIITFGRQGLFCYANLDDVLDMSFKVAQSNVINSRSKIDYDYLFYEYLNLSRV